MSETTVNFRKHPERFLPLRYVLILLTGFSLSLSAETFTVPGGEFSMIELSPLEGAVTLSISSIDDSETNYAPATAIVFFGENDVAKYRFGIMKLDGPQRLTAYSDLDGAKLIQSNLSEGQDYALAYRYLGAGVLEVQFSDEQYIIDVGFEPVKVGHMISGMTLQADYEP